MLNPFDPDAFIIRADTHIKDIQPRIFRSLELPVSLNFAQLHEVLQAAFGWTDSHLHQFIVGGLTVGAPEFIGDFSPDFRTLEATEIRLQDLTFPYGEEDPTLTVSYTYDFGDNWCHDLVLRRVPRGATAFTHFTCPFEPALILHDFRIDGERDGGSGWDFGSFWRCAASNNGHHAG